ncbi:MAG: nucleotidyltransferase domain-containing protein [Patescibacteria group bacterium]
MSKFDQPPKIEKTEVDYERRAEQMKAISEIESASLPLTLMGGYAEDALLYGEPKGEHKDLDYILLREDVERVRGYFVGQGYDVQDVTMPKKKQPYKLFAKKGTVDIDLVIFEHNPESNTHDLHVDDRESGESVIFRLDDSLMQPESHQLSDTRVNTLAPLAFIHMREAAGALARRPATDRDKRLITELKQKYYPGVPADSEIFTPIIVKE